MKFATIGSGKIVDTFLEAAALTEFEHAGVYSRSMARAEEFAAKHGVSFCTDDLEEICRKDDIEAVYIATPNYIHFEQGMKMLNAKKHVFLEKPITVNSAELSMLMEAADKNGVVLFEGLKSVFTPQMAAIERGIEKIGKVRHVLLDLSRYSSQYQQFQSGDIPNIFRHQLGAGALTDIGIYPVSVLAHLFGMPKVVGATSVQIGEDSDGGGAILCQYRDMTAEITYSKIVWSMQGCEIKGEEGSILFGDIANSGDVEIKYRNGEIEIIKDERKKPPMYWEIEKFLHLVDHPEEQYKYLERSMISIKILEQARHMLGIEMPNDARLG